MIINAHTLWLVNSVDVRCKGIAINVKLLLNQIRLDSSDIEMTSKIRLLLTIDLSSLKERLERVYSSHYSFGLIYCYTILIFKTVRN